jgi:hypothetical protein
VFSEPIERTFVGYMEACDKVQPRVRRSCPSGDPRTGRTVDPDHVPPQSEPRWSRESQESGSDQTEIPDVACCTGLRSRRSRM